MAFWKCIILRTQNYIASEVHCFKTKKYLDVNLTQDFLKASFDGKKKSNYGRKMGHSSFRGVHYDIDGAIS